VDRGQGPGAALGQLPVAGPGAALGQLPPLRDVLLVLTAAGANESFSSEGAEALGDCILDYLVSLYLFFGLP
jgi:hypothetical protein